MSSEENAPFAIQLEVEFLDRLSEPVREGKVKSVSDLIRTALERFNLENVVVMRPAQVTISARLPAEIRKDLRRVAREKHTSVGQLVRAAVESFLSHLESDSAGQLEMAMPTSIAAESAAPAPQAVTKKRPTGKKAEAEKRGTKSSARPSKAAAKKKKRAR